MYVCTHVCAYVCIYMYDCVCCYIIYYTCLYVRCNTSLSHVSLTSSLSLRSYQHILIILRSLTHIHTHSLSLFLVLSLLFIYIYLQLKVVDGDAVYLFENIKIPHPNNPNKPDNLDKPDNSNSGPSPLELSDPAQCSDISCLQTICSSCGIYIYIHPTLFSLSLSRSRVCMYVCSLSLFLSFYLS